MLSANIEKSNMNAEFITQHKALFESKLASFLFQNPQLFKSVEKVSTAICQLIDTYAATVNQALLANKVQEELSDKKYFCRFKKAYVNMDNTIIIQAKEFKDLFCLEKNNLCQVMQSQAVFIHRIFPEILAKMPIELAHELQVKKENLVNIIFPPQLFADRARYFNEKPKRFSDIIGISKNPVFSKLSGKTDHQRLRAVDQFTIDKNSLFYQESQTENIPLVAGPSGHTGSLLLGALLYGNLNQQELWEYTVACFAFLTTGGHHSFHEVMLIAKQVGIEYELNNYYKNIPPHLLEAAKEVIEPFSQYLNIATDNILRQRI